jgi:hypothetical protein
MKTVKLPDAYPLAWPDGWPRTQYPERNYRYKVGATKARDELADELNRLNARDFVISSNVALRKTDGLPLANQRIPQDPGVAVYWTDREGRPWSLACDVWDQVKHNMRAIYYAVAGIRQIERSGASQLLERAYRGFNALPSEGSGWWREELGLDGSPTRMVVEERYRELARQRHPDHGGSQEAMVRLNRAREAALMEVA